MLRVAKYPAVLGHPSLIETAKVPEIQGCKWYGSCSRTSMQRDSGLSTSPISARPKHMISLQKNLHLKRSREIAGVLIGHGWDNLLETFEHAGVGNSYHDAQRGALRRPEIPLRAPYLGTNSRHEDQRPGKSG